MPETRVVVFRASDAVVPLKRFLEELETIEPKAYAKCLQRVLMLQQFGHELRRPIADQLREGIFELRARSGRVHYRMLYFFHGAGCAILSHGFTKEGKVPAGEIENAKKHRALVTRDFERYTAEWEI